MEQEIYSVTIPNPIEYLEIGTKTSKKTGKVTPKRIYTTANIYFSGIHFKVREQIVNTCKQFLAPYFKNCPRLDDPPYSVVIQYCRKGEVDIDNKCYFWNKLIQDLLSPSPTKKIPNPNKKLEDDDSRYIDCLGWEYYPSEDHCMNVLIFKNT